MEYRAGQARVNLRGYRAAGTPSGHRSLPMRALPEFASSRRTADRTCAKRRILFKLISWSVYDKEIQPWFDDQPILAVSPAKAGCAMASQCGRE